MAKIISERGSLLLSLILFCGVQAHATDYYVGVYSAGYTPKNLLIAPGDSVYWINDDDFGSHTVTSADNLWSRGYLLNYQDVFGLTFGSVGTYNYYDDFDGFTGSIVVSSAAAGPTNDFCSSPIAMSEGILYTENTTGATSTGDPTSACGSSVKGVWYTFTPSSNSLVTISTCGSGFDTVLAVFTGSCGSLSALVGGCNDDAGPACTGTRASLAFSGTAGTTYWILAGGYAGATGNLQIIATSSGPPSPPVPWQETQVAFDTGATIARPDTNLIHIVDSTNDRLLTLDTASGTFISSIRLYGKLLTSGIMSFSLDRQTLYIPLYNANKLQVISLASLRTTDLLPLTIGASSIAAGSDGALYGMVNSQITKIDATSGQFLGSVPGSFYSPLVKANNSGTRLYIMELGLSGGGSMIDEYTVVASSLPTYVTNHFNGKENDKDFVIAEDIGWLYSTSGGVYGVGAWNMNTRAYYFWPYDSAYGVAVAMVPNAPLVYGASGDYYAPRIRSFDRLTGAVSNTFNINASGRGNGAVYDRSLKVTPNGRVFYARETRKIGLIGASALNTNTPLTAEIIDAGTNKTVFVGESFSLNATAPAASIDDIYSWSKIAGPGQVTFSSSNNLSTTAQISAAGNYTLEIVRSNTNWVSSDRLYVTAVPRPIQMNQLGFALNGQFQLRVLSGPGSFEIQASSNLINWDSVTNFSSPGDITIADPSGTRTRRFYRARQM
jgi:hypothetical protein